MNTFLGEYNSLKSTPKQVENKNRPVSTKKEVRNLSVSYSLKKQHTQRISQGLFPAIQVDTASVIQTTPQLRGKKENL